MEKYYNIVYDQEFSPSGRYLATCDTFGRIAIFSLQAALSHSLTADDKAPLTVKQVQNGPLYSLASVGPLLACGGCEDIKLWRWEELISSTKDSQPVHVLTSQTGKTGTTDINSLVYDGETNTLFSGGGDNTIQAWDIATGTVKRVFIGHTGYIHCLCLRSGGNILSCGEDATVKMWDQSSQDTVLTWKPAAKPTSGQWVGCVATDSAGDWMVCGGSMPPSIYRITSTNKIATLTVPESVCTQTAIFTNDRIITAGSEAIIRHWAVNGEPLAAVPGGHQHNFSLAHNTQHKTKQYEVLTVTGDSSDIHVFTDFGYRAFSLNIT